MNQQCNYEERVKKNTFDGNNAGYTRYIMCGKLVPKNAPSTLPCLVLFGE
jgi:hypothetical protein